MPRVILSLASNRYQKRNLAKARQCLGQMMPDVKFTRELWTDPINAKRPDKYLNQLATATTTLSADELNAMLKQTECDFGRTTGKRALGIVPIDIDILLYDNQRFHIQDWERTYVQALLPELP